MTVTGIKGQGCDRPKQVAVTDWKQEVDKYEQIAVVQLWPV